MSIQVELVSVEGHDEKVVTMDVVPRVGEHIELMFDGEIAAYRVVVEVVHLVMSVHHVVRVRVKDATKQLASLF